MNSLSSSPLSTLLPVYTVEQNTAGQSLISTDGQVASSSACQGLAVSATFEEGQVDHLTDKGLAGQSSYLYQGPLRNLLEKAATAAASLQANEGSVFARLSRDLTSAQALSAFYPLFAATSNQVQGIEGNLSQGTFFVQATLGITGQLLLADQGTLVYSLRDKQVSLNGVELIHYQNSLQTGPISAIANTSTVRIVAMSPTGKVLSCCLSGHIVATKEAGDLVACSPQVKIIYNTENG